jgi:hypothetical protein
MSMLPRRSALGEKQREKSRVEFMQGSSRSKITADWERRLKGLGGAGALGLPTGTKVIDNGSSY